MFPTTIMLVFTCTMNERDQTRQAFATRFCPFCDSTRKLVHRPQNIKSPNTIQKQTFQNCRQFSFGFIVESSYSQVRIIFSHISSRDLPYHRTKKMLFLHQVSLKLWSVVFLCLQQKSWIRTYLCSSTQYPC